MYNGEQLRIALKNLIKNAVQAMDESRKLTVKIQLPCGAGFSACRETQTAMSAPLVDTAEFSVADTVRAESYQGRTAKFNIVLNLSGKKQVEQ